MDLRLERSPVKGIPVEGALERDARIDFYTSATKRSEAAMLQMPSPIDPVEIPQQVELSDVVDKDDVQFTVVDSGSRRDSQAAAREGRILNQDRRTQTLENASICRNRHRYRHHLRDLSKNCEEESWGSFYHPHPVGTSSDKCWKADSQQ